jgi:ACS family hexuronate transporter-like MFS transporter
VAGGWLSGHLLQRGWSLNRARKATLLVCALAVIPVGYAAYTSNYRLAVALIALAYSAHQAWSATMWIMIADLFPRRVSASVAGFVGMIGSIGAIGLFVVFGAIRETAAAGDYRFIFLSASAAYVVALAILHKLTPRLAPARIQ